MHTTKITGTALVVAAALAASAAQAAPPAGAAAKTPKSAPLRWQPLGEPGSGGAMVGLAVSPYDSKHLLVAGDMLGVGISRDQGNSWQATYGFKTWEMADFTWHPSDPNVVWVGSMSGPYVSRDGGVHWTQKRTGMPPPIGFGYSVPIERVLFDPADTAHTHLLAFGGSSRHWTDTTGALGAKAAWGAVWESRDGGESWTRLSTITRDGSSASPEAKGDNVTFCAYAPGLADTLYAQGDAAGVVASTDGGRTWTRRGGGLPPAGLGRVAVSPRDGRTLWVATDSYKPDPARPRVPGGVWKTTDGGQTWHDSSAGLGQVQSEDTNQVSHYRALAVAPSSPDVLYANDVAYDTGVTYRSDDGGGHWRAVVSKQNIGGDSADPGKARAFQIETACPAGLGLAGITVDPHDPNVSYGFNTETIARSLDGRTWDDATAYHPAGSTGWRGRGYEGWVSTNFRFDPYHPGRAVLQGMDATRGWVSGDGFKSWTYGLYAPDAWNGGRDAAWTRDGHVYVTTGTYNFTGVGRSADGGKTWAVLSGKAHGLPEDYQGVAPGGVYALPSDWRQVWAVIGGRLDHSADGGDTWSVVLDRPGLQWIAADPARPRRFYVSGDRNVYVTDDGAAWTAIGGPHTNSGKMAVDSRGRLLAAGSQSERAGLWRYDPAAPAASRWTRLSDEAFIADVAVDPTDPARIAFATNQNPFTEASSATGVWLSGDGGKTWAQANDGLAMTRGSVVAFNPADPAQLVFGADGRGFWTTRWPKTVALRGTRTYQPTPDDARFAAVAQAPTPPTPTVGNGDMTLGAGLPDRWDGKWVGKGTITPSRDTATFHSAPASLVSSTEGTDAEGNVYEIIDAAEGTTLTISGYVKTQGVAAQVAVQDFGGGYNAFGWQQASYQNPDTDWKPFSKEITLPPGTAHVALVLWVRGKGKAWLDDVKITDVKLPPGQP